MTVLYTRVIGRIRSTFLRFGVFFGRKEWGLKCTLLSPFVFSKGEQFCNRNNDGTIEGGKDEQKYCTSGNRTGNSASAPTALPWIANTLPLDQFAPVSITVWVTLVSDDPWDEILMRVSLLIPREQVLLS